MMTGVHPPKESPQTQTPENVTREKDLSIATTEKRVKRIWLGDSWLNIHPPWLTKKQNIAQKIVLENKYRDTEFVAILDFTKSFPPRQLVVITQGKNSVLLEFRTLRCLLESIEKLYYNDMMIFWQKYQAKLTNFSKGDK